jgi:hypothetical protein
MYYYRLQINWDFLKKNIPYLNDVLLLILQVAVLKVLPQILLPSSGHMYSCGQFPVYHYYTESASSAVKLLVTFGSKQFTVVCVTCLREHSQY